MSLEFHHITSYLLWYCSHHVVCVLLQSSMGEEAMSLEFHHITSYLLWYCSHHVVCVLLQSSMGEEAMSLEFHHITSYLLWYCSHHVNEDLLHEVILSIGYFSVLHHDNQVSTGQHTHMHARTHARTHTHACTHANTHACTHARTHTCLPRSFSLSPILTSSHPPNSPFHICFPSFCSLSFNLVLLPLVSPFRV